MDIAADGGLDGGVGTGEKCIDKGGQKGAASQG